MRQSELEAKFRLIWEEIGPKGYELCEEVRFHPDRKWRFDFAIMTHWIAIEVEGGGRHQTFQGFKQDCLKYNWATSQGWLVLRFTNSDMTRDKRYEMIDTIEETIISVEQRSGGALPPGYHRTRTS